MKSISEYDAAKFIKAIEIVRGWVNASRRSILAIERESRDDFDKYFPCGTRRIPLIVDYEDMKFLEYIFNNEINK